MTEILGVLAFGVLFAVFGLFHRRSEDSAGCGVCPSKDDLAACGACHIVRDISESNHAET